MEITDPFKKQKVADTILRALPEWFGLEESRNEYVKKAAGCPFLCAEENGEPVGFLYLKETGKATAEILVMGVRKEFHRRGTGRALMKQAIRIAQKLGYSFLQVKTVQMGRYPEYDQTNRFYQAMGFQEFEVFETLWDPWNPCQVYVRSIEGEKKNG